MMNIRNGPAGSFNYMYIKLSSNILKSYYRSPDTLIDSFEYARFKWADDLHHLSIYCRTPDECPRCNGEIRHDKDHWYENHHECMKQLTSTRKDNDCYICTDVIQNTELPLSCGHTMHLECLLMWTQPTCPACRAPIQEFQIENMQRQLAPDDDSEIPEELQNRYTTSHIAESAVGVMNERGVWLSPNQIVLRTSSEMTMEDVGAISNAMASIADISITFHQNEIHISSTCDVQPHARYISEVLAFNNVIISEQRMASVLSSIQPMQQQTTQQQTTEQPPNNDNSVQELFNLFMSTMTQLFGNASSPEKMILVKALRNIIAFHKSDITPSTAPSGDMSWVCCNAGFTIIHGDNGYYLDKGEIKMANGEYEVQVAPLLHCLEQNSVENIVKSLMCIQPSVLFDNMLIDIKDVDNHIVRICNICHLMIPFIIRAPIDDLTARAHVGLQLMRGVIIMLQIMTPRQIDNLPTTIGNYLRLAAPQTMREKEATVSLISIAEIAQRLLMGIHIDIKYNADLIYSMAKEADTVRWLQS